MGGTVTWATPKLVGEIMSYHIKPITGTTQYNFVSKDPDGLIILESATTQTGELAEYPNKEIINEILTCTISGATVNEAFTIIIRIMADGVNR